jgi:hypothetical protein
VNSDLGVQILDSLCDDGHVDCNNMLSSITGFCTITFVFVLYLLEKKDVTAPFNVASRLSSVIETCTIQVLEHWHFDYKKPPYMEDFLTIIDESIQL